jgi:hypothetical protein
LRKIGFLRRKMSTPTPDDVERKMAEFMKALSSKDIEFLVSMAQQEDEEQQPTASTERLE